MMYLSLAINFEEKENPGSSEIVVPRDIPLKD